MATPVISPIVVGFHSGHVLTILSQLYGSGPKVIREAVQNAIDEGATFIYIDIDCVRKYVNIYDNGEGATLDDIRKKFEKIGSSLKTDKVNKIGQKGIGNLAGLTISNRWEFITRRLGGGKFFRFTFESSELEKGDNVNVHPEELPIKSLGSDSVSQQSNSLVRLHEVSDVALKQLKDHNAIKDAILDAFNSVIRRNDIKITVRYKDFKNKTNEFLIKPNLYRGVPKDKVVYDTEYGEISFNFFHSPDPLDKPNILVQHQGVTSIPLHNFFRRKVLPTELEHLFVKGFFEGDINLGFCTINADRDSFVLNNEIKVFADTIVKFAEDVLRPLIEQFEKADRKEKLKKIADSVMKKLRNYFRDNPSLVPPSLKSLIAKPGNVSTDVGVTKTDPIKNTKKKSEDTLPSGDLRKKKEEGEERRKVGTGVLDQKSKKEVFEAVDGLGMHFVHPDADDGFKWHSRINRQGILEVNIANTNFLEAEKRGQIFLGRYLTLLLQAEMTSVSVGGHEAENFHTVFELMLENFFGLSLLE